MLEPLNVIKPATQQPSSAQDNVYLNLADLDAVAGGGSAKQQSGGNLYGLCCKGTHIPKVTIES